VVSASLFSIFRRRNVLVLSPGYTVAEQSRDSRPEHPGKAANHLAARLAFAALNLG